MKYYKNSNNDIYAYESDGSQDYLINPNYNPVSLSQVQTIQAAKEAAAIASTIPNTVTPFQAKAALLNAGLLTNIIAIINDPSTPAITKLAWDNVTEFTRDSPLLNGLAQTLGLTSTQVDALFLAASKIEI